MKKLIHKFCKLEIAPHANDFFLLGAVFIFSLLRIPSLIEPEWYGDEGIYQVIGAALQNGSLLYRDIWDNKPPLLYIYYALVNGDLFAIKFLSLLFGIAAVITFFFLAKKLFQNNKLSLYISTGMFVYLFGSPVLEGNVANAENFILFPILLAFFLVTRLTSRSHSILPISIGFILSIAFLTKIVAIFDLGAILVVLFCLRFYNKKILDVRHHLISNPREFIKIMKQELLILIAFVVPVLFTWLFFIISGASNEFLSATFSNNIGYVGWKNYFVLQLGVFKVSIPQGLLLFKIILLLVGVFLIITYRKLFSVASLIIYTWLVFSIFNAFFSGRPYTHYLLTLVPAFCLLAGLLFISARKKIVFHTAALILVVLLVKGSFDYYEKVVAYYQNYHAFVMGTKNVSDYQRFFDQDTPKNYVIAEFIKDNTDKQDNVFLVSNSSTIYFMAGKLPPGRYIVGYHIEGYKDAIDETKKAVLEKQPKYIISTNDNLASDFIDNYELQYILHNVKIYEKQL